MAGRIVICGTGSIGRALAVSLSQDHGVIVLSARELISGGRDKAVSGLSGLGEGDSVTAVFAHGNPVTTLRRKKEFDAALETRIVPLNLMLEVLGERAYAPVRPILISCAVAGLGGRNLDRIPRWLRAGGFVEMQMRYEAAFLRRTVGFRNPLVARVPTVIGPGSQFEHGLERLAETAVLSRVRMAGDLRLPTTSMARLTRSVSDLVGKEDTGVVDASRRWRTYDEAVETYAATWPTFWIPRQMLARIMSALGVRPEFLFLARQGECERQRQKDGSGV